MARMTAAEAAVAILEREGTTRAFGERYFWAKPLRPSGVMVRYRWRSCRR